MTPALPYTMAQGCGQSRISPSCCMRRQRPSRKTCTLQAVAFALPCCRSACLFDFFLLSTLKLICCCCHPTPLQVPPHDRETAEKLQSHLLLLRGALTAHGMTATPQVLLQPQAEDRLKAKMKPSQAKQKKAKKAGKAAAAAAAGKG